MPRIFVLSVSDISAVTILATPSLASISGMSEPNKTRSPPAPLTKNSIVPWAPNEVQVSKNIFGEFPAAVTAWTCPGESLPEWAKTQRILGYLSDSLYVLTLCGLLWDNRDNISFLISKISTFHVPLDLTTFWGHNNRGDFHKRSLKTRNSDKPADLHARFSSWFALYVPPNIVRHLRYVHIQHDSMRRPCIQFKWHFNRKFKRTLAE